MKLQLLPPDYHWHFRSGADATKMEETQEKALLLVFDDYHLSYPTHYIKHNIVETSCN